MMYRLYFAYRVPPETPTDEDLRYAILHEFSTIAEALSKACDILRMGKYVAAIDCPDGTRLVPSEIRSHCSPTGRKLR
jgi:hypothetical protein